MIVTGAKKGAVLAKNLSGRGFWDTFVFFENMGRYLIKNISESAGVPMKKLLEQGYKIRSALG